MQHEPKKIALFVDFDNIYLGLRETSREAAEAFATRPAVWLKWIEHGMPLGDVDPVAPRENRVLIRQCYLNPDSFGKYRGYFTRAGFTVVDCPSLTSRGKNSSDIVMVMDILDALRHETRFDRFVIMSADADFTPVLQRLRAHDRRTAVMVSGQAAPAYRAACDRLIEEDVFIEHALELALPPEPPRAPGPAGASASALQALTANRDPALLAAIGRRVYEEASSSGTLPASELPRILREFKEFTPSSNWLGYYSLQALTEAILVHRPELRITDDDPWRIAVQVADEPVPAPAASADAPRPAAEAEPPDFGALRERVVRLVARMVAESAEPVVMGKAAHAAIQEVGPLLTETRWLGKGTFKNLLLSAAELPFTVVASPLPGFVFHPERHQPPSERAAVDGLAELAPEMASLVRRISQLTDAPRLTPRQYRVMWEVIAKELVRAPYNLMGTGKAVRDQCVERGEPIARQAITCVLRGLGYVGYRFFDAPHRAEDLAVAYRGNLLNILRQAQVTLSDDELRMLDEWLLASAPEAPAAASESSTAAPSPSRRRTAPADPDAATEPDYAAWADALLAGESRDRHPPFTPDSQPEPTSADASTAPQDEAVPADARPDEPTAPSEPTPWPLADAPLFASGADASPRAGEPLFGQMDDARPGADDLFEWPPADALRFEPVDTRPSRKIGGSEWPPADALLFEPTPPEPRSNGAPADASPSAEPPVADTEPSAPLAAADDSPPADAPPFEPVAASDVVDGDAVSADADAGDTVHPAAGMQDGDTVPSVDESAQPAIEGEPQSSDVVPAGWQLSPGSAEPDEFPWEVVSESDRSRSDAAPADWQLAGEPAGPADEPSAATDLDSAIEAPLAEAHDAGPDAAEAVPADWEMAEDSPPPAADEVDAAHPAAEASHDGDAPPSGIVPAEWQPADEAPPASSEADSAIPSESAAPEPSSAVEPEPVAAPEPEAGDIFAASWELAADAPAGPEEAASPAESEGEADAPSTEVDAEAPGAPEAGDGEVVTAQWEAVEDESRDGGLPPAADAPAEPATQMDAFPPDSPRDSEPRGEPSDAEQVPAELSAAPDAAPTQQEPPPQERPWWQ